MLTIYLPAIHDGVGFNKVLEFAGHQVDQSLGRNALQVLVFPWDQWQDIGASAVPNEIRLFTRCKVKGNKKKGLKFRFKTGFYLKGKRARNLHR